MSTTQRRSDVIDAGTDALDAVAGSMMCKELWLFTDTNDVAVCGNLPGAFCSELALVVLSASTGNDVGATSGFC